MKRNFNRIASILFLIVSLITLSGSMCNRTESYKIGIMQFSHETCTFCPSETTVADFEYYGPPLRGDDVLSASEYIEGFVKMAGELKVIKPVGLYSPRDSRGGSSGSWITREAFDKYVDGAIEDIRSLGPLDGIYLSLHGAMAVTGIPKPEAEIVRRVRKVAGDIPIFVTLDLHANEDHELSDVADAVFIIKRYPHYDAFLQGERAARLMVQTLRGEYIPVMATRKPGVITPSVFQGTGVSPAMEIMEKARRIEEQFPGVYVSVAFGFAYADVPDVGATVMVITNNNKEQAEEIADEMNEYIWRLRESFAGKKIPDTSDGIEMALMAQKEGKTPVIIADHSDRTGNSTHILEELIRRGAENFCIATLADSIALGKILKEGKNVGDTISMMMGGYADEYAGNPVLIEGRLDYLKTTEGNEHIAVIRFGNNNRIIVTSVLNQVTTTGIFSRLGIPLEEMEIISLKSRVHFRRGFYETGIAGTIIEIDAPGLGPADLTKIKYRNIPEGLYPLSGK